MPVLQLIQELFRVNPNTKIHMEYKLKVNIIHRTSCSTNVLLVEVLMQRWSFLEDNIQINFLITVPRKQKPKLRHEPQLPKNSSPEM